jgi:hypothetical protein
MLQAPVTTLTTAKLDISLLLKSTPTPSPTSSSASRAGRVDGPHEKTIARSLSVPPKTESLQAKNSVSSTISAPTTASQPLQQEIPYQMDIHQQPRPLLPPLVSTSPSYRLSPPNQLPSRLPSPHQQALLSGPLHPSVKRQRPNSPLTAPSPAKRQSKWTPDEDAIIIELRGSGMKWEDISKRLPGRSAISCRLHYQNYLERRSEWDEEKKNRLARLYER